MLLHYQNFADSANLSIKYLKRARVLTGVRLIKVKILI